MICTVYLSVHSIFECIQCRVRLPGFKRGSAIVHFTEDHTEAREMTDLAQGHPGPRVAGGENRETRLPKRKDGICPQSE